MPEWYKYGGEKNEQEIMNLLLRLRRTNWAEYQRAKMICYLAVRSGLHASGLDEQEPAQHDKIIKLSEARR